VSADDMEARTPALEGEVGALIARHALLDTLERQAAEIERLRALLMLARPFVADDTEATCDLADRIDAALTGEDAGGKG